MLYIWDLDPVALSFMGLEIRWYGLAYVLGFFLFSYAGWWIYERWFFSILKIQKPDFENLIFGGFVYGILGGRLGHFLFYRPWDFFSDPLEIFRVWNGGMSIHGGIFLVSLYVILWAKKYKVSAFSLGDLLVLPLACSLVFGRFANFLNGELVGRITNQSWGVVFPHVDELLRHPSQLYEMGKNAVLVIIIFYALKKGWQKSPGKIFGIFLFGYGVLRFGIEFFREPEVFWGNLTMGQVLCSVMMVLGSFFFFTSFLHKKL